jgi:hypothetical protein
MKKLIAGLGLLYLGRGLLTRRRRLEPRHGLTLLGFGAVAAGVWFGMRAIHSDYELPPRLDEPWTSRKKQRHEERVAAAKAREQATVRPPAVKVEKDAATALKVPLKDLTS